MSKDKPFVDYQKSMGSNLTLFMSGLALIMSLFPQKMKAQIKVRKVVIDAGHGGHDPGCLGSFTKEKDIALAIALELGTLIQIQQTDVEVIYTRADDTFVDLKQRARIANQAGADLFISIHCNAHRRRAVFGTETYVMGLGASQENLRVAMRENEVIFKEENYEENYNGFDPTSPVSYILMANYQQSSQDNSIRLASKIEAQFQEKLSRTSRGVKQQVFLVLAHTSMPSVLVEAGFLTNKEEEGYLSTPLGQAQIAANIYRAFRDYKNELEGNYREY